MSKLDLHVTADMVIKELQARIAQLEAALTLITDIGVDYDGYSISNEGLRGLIDEMLDYARNPEKAYRLIQGEADE